MLFYVDVNLIVYGFKWMIEGFKLGIVRLEREMCVIGRYMMKVVVVKERVVECVVGLGEKGVEVKI